MKTLRAVIAFVIAVSGNALAQGTIDFHNPNTFPLRFVDFSDGTTGIVGAPGSPLGPASVRVGLFVGTGTSFASLTMVGMTTNSSSTLPLFVGTFNGGNPYPIAGHPQNEVVNFAFAAWSISTGAMTIQEALASTGGFVGVSAIGRGYTLSGGGTPPALTFGTPTAAQPWLLDGITLSINLPEPSTLVLGLAGAVLAWMFRRRK
jgi:hypothetical protein